MLHRQFCICSGMVLGKVQASGAGFMNFISIMDIAAAVLSVSALSVTVVNRSLANNIRILVLGLTFFGLAYYIFLSLGHTGICERFESAEDITGAILPFWWAFVFYGLDNKVLLDALGKSEKRHKELIHNIPGAVYRCSNDRDWTMHFISNRIEKLSGYPASDFINNSVRTFNSIIHPDDRETVRQIIQQVTGKNTIYHFEYRIIDSQGNIRWLVDRGQAARDPQGRLQWLDGAVFDITERKRAEQEREKINAVLTSKNEEMETLLQVTSHDLKSPITNIDGFSGELEKAVVQLEHIENDRSLSQDQKNKQLAVVTDDIFESIRFIKTGSEKLRSLLDGLLKVSRLSRNPVSPETLYINPILDRIRQSMTYQLRKNDIELEVSALPQCIGDKLMVEQVFTNLIDNAIKYSSPDRRCKIKIGGYVENDKSVYCVEDNGIGIAPENLKSIFEIFYRIDHTDNIEGQGLGLTIVKRMLKLQNGDIRVESLFGKGSKFYVTLPNW